MRLTSCVAAVALVVAAGCGDDTGPKSIAGTYHATTFTEAQTGQQPVNVLTAGGSLTITITADNKTSGTLFIPKAIAGTTTDFTAGMTGSAVIAGNTVTFAQTADTFVRDVVWTIGDNTLTTTSTISGTINVTLTRQ